MSHSPRFSVESGRKGSQLTKDVGRYVVSTADDALDPNPDEHLAPHEGPDPVGWRRDFNRRRQDERLRLLARARDVFGDPLAEVILTHAPEHLIGLSAAAATRSDEDLMPLRNAVMIAHDLSKRASASTIRAWFVGLNTSLDDQEPALVVRDNPNAVRDAARAFLASG